MASKGQTSSRRLINELQKYERDPSEALVHLGPVDDHDLMHWTAVLKGPSDTPYEGIHFLNPSIIIPSRFLDHPSVTLPQSHKTATTNQATNRTGGLWQLDILVPETYPNAPPTIRFVTPICHPNVHFRTGEICLDLLKTAWSPAYTIASTLNSIQQLLTSAEPDSPLNIDIAQLFRQGDQVAAEALIRFYTETERWQPR